MYFSREQVYEELKRLYNTYNPCKRTISGIGRVMIEDDQVTIYTSYRWKGPEGRWILTNYYNGKYMDVIMPTGVGSNSEMDDIGRCYSKITFDPYVPKEIGKALNLVWRDGVSNEGRDSEGFFDMLGNRLIIEYHYKTRENYLYTFLSPDEKASKKILM